MRSSAPPDIAEQFEKVLDAVAESERALKPGGRVREVADPLFGDADQAAFDTVQDYECR